MKTLGLAFVIVAIAGFVVYILFGYVLNAEGLAGAFAGLVFGTLPFIHQELEKQAAKKVLPGGVATPEPSATQAAQSQQSNQVAPAAGQWQTSTGPATPTLPQQGAMNTAPSPVPTYVPYVQATGNMASPAQAQSGPSAPAPKAATKSLAAAGASSWVVLLVYGVTLVISVRGASVVAGRLFYRWYENLDGTGSSFLFVFLGSWLPLLIVAVGVFLIGMWIGLKAPGYGWLITLGAVVIGLLVARLINVSGIVNYDESNAFLNDYLLPRDETSVEWRFANPGDYDRLYQTLSWAFIFGVVVIESLVALVGWWLGAILGRSRARAH